MDHLRIPQIAIQRTTSAQQVANGLSDLILSGKVKPGQRLRESSIATELGVARNTVREAIRQLENAGLVKIEVNRGVVAISPSMESLATLYGARLVIEKAAAASINSQTSFTRLQNAYDEFIASMATQDVNVIVKNDLAFHATIVGLLNSPRIDLFYAQICRELRFYLVYLSTKNDKFLQAADVKEEHQPILEALTSLDRQAAADEIEKHITKHERRVASLIFDQLFEDGISF